MTREQAIMKLLIEQDKMDRYYSLMVSSSLVSWFEKGRERFCQTVTNNSREAKIMEYPSTQVNRRH